MSYLLPNILNCNMTVFTASCTLSTILSSVSIVAIKFCLWQVEMVAISRGENSYYMYATKLQAYYVNIHSIINVSKYTPSSTLILLFLIIRP